MLYAKINEETNEVVEFPIFEKDLREKYLKSSTLPKKITDFSLVGTPYRCVEPKLTSEVNLVASYTQSIEAVSAVYNEETGEFDRQYGLVDVVEAKREIRKDFRLKELRKKRAEAFSELDAKFLRHASELRLGLTPTDNIEDLDAKAEALRNVTESENLWAVTDDFFEV
jgi:hypothetical protein